MPDTSPTDVTPAYDPDPCGAMVCTDLPHPLVCELSADHTGHHEDGDTTWNW